MIYHDYIFMLIEQQANNLLLNFWATKNFNKKNVTIEFRDFLKIVGMNY